MTPVLVVVVAALSVVNGLRPVVLMHGLLTGNEAMSHIEGFIKKDYPTIYVNNFEIGNGRDDSLFMDLNAQVAHFAATVKADAKLAGGFNLIGHSQGGLITRAYIERYNNPPVYNYISLAGPHGGQFGVPDFNELCPDVDCPWLNDLFSDLLNSDAWLTDWVQSHVSFAAYWHDPFAQQRFVQENIFLKDINNAAPVKNATYRANMLSLNTALLIYALNDSIVVPKESPTFAFFDYTGQGSDAVVVPMMHTPDYVGDWIGLQTLNKAGKLTTAGVVCTHQNLPRSACKAQVYDAYVKNLINN